MIKKTVSTREKIQWLIDAEHLTTYQIAKGSGVPITPFTRLRSGESEIDNLQFRSIEKLVAYYDKINQENTKNSVNGSESN